MTPAEHQKAMKGLIDDVRAETGQRTWEVFSDWIECAAISLSSPFPHRDRAEREKRFARHQEQYGPGSMKRFAQLLGHLTMWLEAERTDALGELFMSLDLGNDHAGQFFTPFEVSRLLVSLTINDTDLSERVQERGFITANDPAVGAGGMLIAFAERMRSTGLNPQTQLHVTGTAVDVTCVHMSHVQLTLLGVPAVIVHGNTLTLEERSHWFTPFHHLGHWNTRLKQPAATPATPITVPAGRTEQTSLFELEAVA